MQKLDVTVFKYASLSNAGSFAGGEKVVTPIDLDGRVSVRFVYAGIVRTANIRAQDGWSVSLFEDGNELYACSHDTDRNTVCVERFRSGDAPQVRMLTGVERSSVLGPSFATDDPEDLVEAVKDAGFP